MTFAELLIAVTRIVRDSNRVRWVLLVTFATVYFLVMSGSYQIYGRLSAPALPDGGAPVGRCDGSCSETAPPRAVAESSEAHLLALALVGGLIVVPARTSIGFNRNLGRVTTVDLA